MSSTGIKSRLSHAQWSLKPQDLAMAFKLVYLAGKRMPYTELARAMQMSQFEAHACLARLSGARLLTEVNSAPALVMPAFRPLVLQGAAYFFPAVRGEVTVGFPTANGAEPLKSKRMPDDELPPVWPHPVARCAVTRCCRCTPNCHWLHRQTRPCTHCWRYLMRFAQVRRVSGK